MLHNRENVCENPFSSGHSFLLYGEPSSTMQEKLLSIKNILAYGKGGASMPDKAYIAIDLKSFYASVECIERGLDPLTTNLVVADESRSTKTICLAATPSLKSYGIPGRARLFEVVQKTKEANFRRKALSPKHILEGESCDAKELAANPSLALGYIAAKPRMALYVSRSSQRSLLSAR